MGGEREGERKREERITLGNSVEGARISSYESATKKSGKRKKERIRIINTQPKRVPQSSRALIQDVYGSEKLIWIQILRS